MNKVVSFILVLSILFVGLGFASLDESSPNMKFSEICEPFFNVFSEVADAARSVVDFFVSTDSNVPSDEEIPIVSSWYANRTPDKYLYFCEIKTHGSWHSCYLLRTFVGGQGGRISFIVVYDESSSHSLEGWECTGSFLDSVKTIVPILSSIGFAFPKRVVRNWFISGYTYLTLQAAFPDHPLYSNVDSVPDPDPPVLSDDPSDPGDTT